MTVVLMRMKRSLCRDFGVAKFDVENKTVDAKKKEQKLLLNFKSIYDGPISKYSSSVIHYCSSIMSANIAPPIQAKYLTFLSGAITSTLSIEFNIKRLSIPLDIAEPTI